MDYHKNRFPALTKRELAELSRHHLHRHWLDNFLRLQLFHETYGRLPLQKEQYPKGIRIGSWSHRQRLDYRNGKMPEWRARLLSTLNFEWGSSNEPWEEKYRRAKKLQNKKCTPLSRYSGNEEERLLKLWLYDQAYLISKGKIPEHRKRKLLNSGLIVDRMEYRWNRVFAMVKYFIDKNGILPSAHSEDPHEKMLGKWRLHNISRMNAGLLTKDQTDRMKKLGLDKKIIDTVWEDKYHAVIKALDRYFSRKKDLQQTSIIDFIGSENYVWWRDQWKKIRKNAIGPSRLKQLKQAGLHLHIKEYRKWRSNKFSAKARVKNC